MFGVTTWEEVRNLSFIFKKIVDVPGIEIERVHPWQQRAVAKINAAVRDDKRIERVVLFGSSVNMRCTLDSDLDLVIDMNDTSNEAKLDVSEKIQEACDWNADILWRDRLTEDDRVFQEAKRGVRIV